MNFFVFLPAGGQFLGCRIGMIESLILFIFFGLSGSTPEQSHQGVLILSQVSLMFSSVIAWPSNVSTFLWIHQVCSWSSFKYVHNQMIEFWLLWAWRLEFFPATSFRFCLAPILAGRIYDIRSVPLEQEREIKKRVAPFLASCSKKKLPVSYWFGGNSSVLGWIGLEF